MVAMSCWLCAVVMKHGKLSRMWMPRLRIIANSRSCSGWSSSEVDAPERREVLDLDRRADLAAERVQLVGHRRGAQR